MFTNLKKKDYIGIAKLLVTRQFSSSTTNKDRNINEMNFKRLRFPTGRRQISWLQSTLFKKDTFGTGTSCLSQRDVRLIESQIEGVKKGRDQLWLSILQTCPSYKESNKGSQERQGPTLGVRFTEVYVLQRVKIKGVKKGRDQLQLSILQRCPSYRESK